MKIAKLTPNVQSFINGTDVSYHLDLAKCMNSLIAFDERVTFWLQRVRSMPCACAFVALFMLFARRLAYNHYAITHAYNAANTHAQDSDPAR